MKDLDLIKAVGSVSVANVEQILLGEEQIDCPVYHHHAPGLYIREAHFPAGAFILGHEQRFGQMNVFLKGKVLMLDENGGTKELTAPMTFFGSPGRKMGVILEDVVWQNIYPTDLTNVEELEAHFFIKSDNWLEDNRRRFLEKQTDCQPDRDDFKTMCDQISISPEQITTESETTHDIIPMPPGWGTVAVFDSPISGKGLFATVGFKRGDTIAPALIDGKRTPAGRYVNHSPSPNAALGVGLDGNLWAVAIRTIEGCKGGQLGDEITFDYRQSFSVGVRKEEICQE